MADNPLALRRAMAQVEDADPMFDSDSFSHMARVAEAMAHASVIPDHLKVMVDANGRVVRSSPGQDPGPVTIDYKGTAGNCLLIVTQGRAWNVNPFMLAQCTYINQGRLGFEGKLIHAVLEKKVGNPFSFSYTGEGDDRTISVTNRRIGDGELVSTSGSVRQWATNKRDGSKNWQWIADPDKMLRYRGVREWGRAWAPGLMLGVMSDDELEDLKEDFAARRARDVSRAEVNRIPAAAAIDRHVATNPFMWKGSTMWEDVLRDYGERLLEAQTEDAVRDLTEEFASPDMPMSFVERFMDLRGKRIEVIRYVEQQAHQPGIVPRPSEAAQDAGPPQKPEKLSADMVDKALRQAANREALAGTFRTLVAPFESEWSSEELADLHDQTRKRGSKLGMGRDEIRDLTEGQ